MLKLSVYFPTNTHLYPVTDMNAFTYCLFVCLFVCLLELLLIFSHQLKKERIFA